MSHDLKNSSSSSHGNDSDNEDNNSSNNKTIKKNKNKKSKNNPKKDNKKDKNYSGKNNYHKSNIFECSHNNIKIIKFYREGNGSYIFDKYASILNTGNSLKDNSDFDLNKKLFESMFEKRIKIYYLKDDDISQSYYINYLNQKKIAIRKKYV